MNVVYMICFFMVGTVLGSFYNVLGFRIPKHESVVKPRSHCEKCGHVLKWYELIPIFSFIFLKGRCYNCRTKLSWMYMFSEVFCGLLFMICYYSYGFTWELLIGLTISSMLIMVIVSDLTYMIIPDRFIVIPSIIVFITKIIAYGFKEALISLLFGIFAFTLMYLIMRLGSYIFQKEALGGADVKLMFTVGLCVGPFLSLVVIVIASVIALPVSLLLYFKERENIIPFGPFLVIGLLIVLFTKLDAETIIRFLLGR